MEGMEEKLGEILDNPQIMQQIMQLAQSLNSPKQPSPKEQPQKEAPAKKQSIPSLSVSDGIDPALFAQLATAAGKSNIDSNQKALLRALTPYLSRERIIKLEKAMRAAKLADMASSFIHSGGLKRLSGR